MTDGTNTGDRFVLNAVVQAGQAARPVLNAIRQNLGTLRNRINALGVSEPMIQQQGDSRIVVELAGVQDHRRSQES